jgi:tetratricopeptide (TPR) repeat protein
MTHRGIAGVLLTLALCARLEGQTPGSRESSLERAAAMIQAGDARGAEAQLRKVLGLAPKDVDALSLLGGALGMQGRLEESSRAFESALQLTPGNAALRRNLAANQVNQGRLGAAASNLEMILKSDPGDREAILMLGFVRARERRYPQAVAALERVPDLVRQSVDHMAALARAYYGTNQKDKGRAQLQHLRQMTTNPNAYYLGGQIALEAGDLAAAETLFDAARSASHPNPALITYQLARIRYNAGRFREARELLEPVANSAASNGTVLNLLAWSCLKEGDEATGIKILSYATDRFPAEPGNFLDLGKIYLKGNRVDAALDVVKRGAAVHAGSAPLLELEGELETRQGLHGQAVESYRQAVRLNPRSQEALLALALAQTNLLRHKDAVATFEKGLRLFPADARFYAEYGKVLLLPWASGESPDAPSKAERLLRRAVQLDPSHASAHFELGSQLLKTGQAAEAAVHLEKATVLDPSNSHAHFVLARAYRTLGRPADAAREMQLFQSGMDHDKR